MMKGLGLKWIILVVFCSVMPVMTSCAKKSVKMEEEVGPPTAAPEPKKPEKESETPRVLTGPDTEAARKTEFEHRAMLQEEAEQLREQIRLFESETIYFDFDESDLKPEARAILTKKAAWLRENPTYSVRIEGHCDERGTGEYNLALGERRADAAKKFIIALGISEKRLATVSYGEEKPADLRRSEDGWARNRRAEFKLIK